MVWHISILVSARIKHSSHNILSLMFSAGEVVTCFFLELPKCSQNRAVAHPYSMKSIIFFLFCLENLVKMGLAQKKRWARHHKTSRSDLSSAAWWLSGPHMTSIWWLNPTPDVTSETSLVLVVPFIAGSKIPTVATLYFHRMKWQYLESGSLLSGIIHPSLPGL